MPDFISKIIYMIKRWGWNHESKQHKDFRYLKKYLKEIRAGTIIGMSTEWNEETPHKRMFKVQYEVSKDYLDKNKTLRAKMITMEIIGLDDWLTPEMFDGL